MELRIPVDRLRSRDLPLVCAKTGQPADHVAQVVADGEKLLVPVSRAAVHSERTARRVELAAYAGGLTAVAAVTMVLTLAGARPAGGVVVLLLALALAGGAAATLRRRRSSLRAHRDGDVVVLRGAAPAFASAVNGAPTSR